MVKARLKVKIKKGPKLSLAWAQGNGSLTEPCANRNILFVKPKKYEFNNRASLCKKLKNYKFF